MMPDSEQYDDSKELSARETAELIQSFSKMLEISDLKSHRLVAALDHVGRILKRQGNQPISSVRILSSPKPSRGRVKNEPKIYRDITLDEVRRIISNNDVSRMELAAVAYARFGVPKSRMSRARLDEAIDIIRAAANHEESLNLIASNAQESGSSRKS